MNDSVINNYSPLPDKIIRIPIWCPFEIFFALPSPILFFLGITFISDGYFDTRLWKPNLGTPVVIIGFILLFISIHFFYRLIKFPGIIFTRDTVIIPPVRFLHWRRKVVPYAEITNVSGSKFQCFIYCGNKKITITKHNNKHNLWNEFRRELHNRHKKALKEKRINKKNDK